MDYDHKILMEKWKLYVDSLVDWQALAKGLKVVPYVEDNGPVTEWWGDL